MYCPARSHPCGFPVVRPHLLWAAREHITAHGDQLPREGGVAERVSSHKLHSKCVSIKCQGRELRVGGRQIKSPMLSVSMVPRGSGGLDITAKCKCIVCRVHSEQGARLCWWPLGFV